MPRATPIILNFNGGEVSGLLDSRIDLEIYQRSCRRLENFIPLRQGAITKRPGTYFVKPTKTGSARSWLGRFVFNRTDAYILEFGNQYIRFYTQGGQVQDGASPLEVASPWTTADLTNGDGAFALRWAQEGDILWLFGGNRSPRKLSRQAATSWTLEEFLPEDGPFLEKNKTDTTVSISAATGDDLTITASASIFTANHVGSLFRIWDDNKNKTAPWVTNKSVSTNNLRRSDGKIYRAVAGGTTGADKPTHEEGVGSDGAVEWAFVHAGYGVARITAVASGTSATADVLTEMPAEVVTGVTPTKTWEFGAWSTEAGWPSSAAFYRGRLAVGGGLRRWFSGADDFESFKDRTASEVLDSDGITIRTNGEFVNRSHNLVAAGDLVDLTDGAEGLIKKITDSDPFAPDNVQFTETTAYGSRDIRAVRAHDRVLFVDRTGVVVREIYYSFETDSFKAADLAKYVARVARSAIVDVAWQGSPVDCMWFVLADGRLASLLYDPNEGIASWHYHVLGGGLLAEAVETIPRSDTGGDEVWLQVKKDASTRWVLRMADLWEEGDARDDAFFVDAGLTYDGSAATVISGLDHLDGETVAYLADGAIQVSPANRPTVTDGSITIKRAASTVHVGLPISSYMQPMYFEAGAGEGTAQGRKKGLYELYLRVMETRGLQVGPDEARLKSVDRRDPATVMGTAEALDTGLIKVEGMSRDYPEDATFLLFHDEPVPANVLAAIVKIVTND